MKIHVLLLVVFLAALPSFGQSTATVFKNGSLIIPMDNAKQNLLTGVAFNVKAYGLVNILLQNNIPVHWIIKDGKAKDATDFSVAANRLYPTTTSSATLNFSGGPFIIDSLWVAKATPFITAYGNNVAVYRANASFSAPVRYQLMFKPKIAVFTNGGGHGVHTKALRLAGFTSPAHFDSIQAQTVDLGGGCYTFACDPHWEGGGTTPITNHVTLFLNSGGNFFAQCAAVDEYEDLQHYHTTNGIEYENSANMQDNVNLYLLNGHPLIQFDGILINAPTGTVVNFQNNSGAYQSAIELVIKKNPTPTSGTQDGDVVLSSRKTGPAALGGIVTYLGGHDYLKAITDPGSEYTRANDVTWNNGLRIFYNAIFMPSTRPTACNFVFKAEAVVTSSVSATQPCTGSNITYTVSLNNQGPGTANDVIVKSVVPAGLTYVTSTAGQGSYNSTNGIWTIGDIPPSTTRTLTITFTVSSAGSYTLKSYNADLLAGNVFTNDTTSLTFQTENTPPAITAPANVITNTNTGCTRTGLTLEQPVVSDACGIASVTNNAPAAFPLGVTTVTWTVTDNSGNTATATNTVKINDTENPTITAPSAIVTSTNTGCTRTGLSLGTPVTADNCGVGSVTNNAPSTFPLGVTTVTWTVTDNSGNTATATQTVTVNDTQNPTITAPSAIVTSTNTGCTRTGLALGAPTTSDNCGVASVTNNAPSAFPLGVTTVTWTVTDNSGNTATATQAVTVNDTQNPTITAPPAIVTSTNTGCTRTGLALGTPATADNCGVASVTNNAPGIFPLGSTTVTWTVTDNSGNTATAAQTVTINDTENPTITAPSAIVTSTNTGCTRTGLALGTAATSDNCGVASVTNNAPSTFPLGITTVTWTVTDNSGNTATATQTVTINDTEDPTITAPSAVVTTTNTGCTRTGLAFGTATTADNCGVASVTNNAPGIFPLGITTVTWTVTDNSGNTATATQTITINDTENPAITAPPAIVTSTNTGCTRTGLALGTATTSDNCGVASVTNNAPSTFPLGITTVTWTVTDNSGNTATATQTVTVNDTENPTITAPANVSVSTNSGCTATGVALGTPATADNCGVATVTNDAPGTFALGTTSVTWTVTDNSGNTATATQTVTISDTENPAITAPPAISTSPNSGCNATGVALGTPATADNCGVASVTNNAPATFPPGMTTVTWTVTDNSGNTATATQTVTVNDTEDPTITAPANVSFSTNSGCTATGVALGTPATADNCTVATVTNNAPGSFSLGTTTVTWTVTDNAGNTATATQTVTISDTQNPTLTVPTNVSVSTNSGCMATGVTLGTPTTADNCGVATVTSDAPGTFPLGTTSVTWTVTDNSGNTATAVQTVTVNDIQDPTITAPANIVTGPNAGCSAAGVALGTPVTADNCGVASVMNNAPATFPSGTTTVTWTVTDNSGNTATATQTVTVTDTENPTITAPAAVSVSTNAGCTATGVALGTPATADNCSVASVTNDAPAVFQQGVTTVTWTVTDNSGNTATATQTVTVSDDEAPVIPNCGDTISSCLPVITFAAPTATDNCGIATFSQTDGSGLGSGSEFPDGYTTLEYTAADISGNTTVCTKVIFKITTPALQDAGKDTTVYNSETRLAAIADTVGIGLWSVISGNGAFEDEHSPGSRVYELAKGENVLSWKMVNQGCPGPEDLLKITYLDLDVPNGFSPDGDNVNDYFEITGIADLAPAALSVVNRWGTVVYEISDYQNDWGGLNADGQRLSDDTYYYQLKLSNDTILTGFIIIKRK